MSGFVHSVKVPTQYKRTAAVLKTTLQSHQTIKSLIFEEKHANLRGMHAVLTKYANNRAEIDYAIEETKILEENPRLSRELCIVLVTELLLGTKNLKGESKPVTIVRQYQDKLVAVLGDRDHNDKTTKDTWPRYLRVNTNILSIDDAFKMLAEEKWRRMDAKFETYHEYLEAIKALEEDEYLVDMHVSGLLVFHPKKKTYWACHPYVLEKKFMLQDKGTCLVGELLAPPPGSKVLDMCAAPGMKTIHLSNLMQNKGKIVSIEQNFDRFRLFCETIEKAQATIVEPVRGDALQFGKNSDDKFEYILVDPTCSGSGMRNRLALYSGEPCPDRINNLAGLQIRMIRHAMTAYPSVKRIAYCTCSLNQAENEEVVQKCLKFCPQFKLLSGKKALRNKWISVGNPEIKKIGKNCIYTRPEVDLTQHGIFIAIFEKRSDDDMQE